MSGPTIKDALDAAGRGDGISVDLSAENLADLAHVWGRWRDNADAQERLSYELADVIPAGAVSLHYYLKTRDPEELHLDDYERAVIRRLRERDALAWAVLRLMDHVDELYFDLERGSDRPDEYDERMRRTPYMAATAFGSTAAWRARQECAALLEWLGGEAVEP